MTTKIYFIFLPIIFVISTLPAQISFEPLNGLYGTSIYTFDVQNESLFLNSSQALYVKPNLEAEWQKIEFPESSIANSYYNTQLGQDGEYYNVINKTIYRLNQNNNTWDVLVELDERPNLIKFGSDGSSAYIKDDQYLMYASSGYDYQEMADLRLIQESYNADENVDFRIEHLLVKGDTYAVIAGDAKESASFLNYYQAGNLIHAEFPQVANFNDPSLDSQLNLYFDGYGLEKFNFVNKEYEIVKYNGSPMNSGFYQYVIDDLDRVIMYKSKDYYVSNDGGANWNEIKPLGEKAVYYQQGILGANGNSFFLSGSSGPGTIAIQQYDTGGQLLNTIATEFEEPVIHKIKLHEDQILLDMGSDEGFLSKDNGNNWELIPRSQMDNVDPYLINGIYYSSDYSGLYQSEDAQNWQKIMAVTAQGSTLGFNDEIALFNNNFAEIYNTNTGENHEIPNNSSAQWGSMHPNGNYYYIEDEQLKIYSPATNNTSTVNDLDFAVGNKSIKIDDDGVVLCILWSFSGLEFWTSSDLGQNFEQASDLILENGLWGDVLVKPSAYYILSDQQLNVSTDKAKSWITFDLDLPEGSYFSSFNVSDDLYVYVALASDQLYRSNEALNFDQKISGTIYKDVDDNCLYENEEGLRNQSLSLTNSAGETLHVLAGESPFELNATPSDYTIKHTIDEALWLSCQTEYLINQNSSDDIHIGIQPIKNCAALDIHYTSIGARRCFDNHMDINICNNGTIPTESGSQINIQLDQFMDYLEANPLPLSIDNQEIIFDIGVIEPFDCFRIRIDYNISCDANLGNEHCILSSINHANLCDDSSIVTEESCFNNVGSFDPNDMHAIVENKWLTEGLIDPELEFVEYVIRFQNTGSDTAFTVELISPLDEYLDWETLKITSFSHPYQYTISDDGLLSILFNNIELPYEDIDEPGSHGYISFVIAKPEKLQEGAIISAQTEIYFDFNEPIITNEVLLYSSILDDTNDLNPSDISIWPNPMSTYLLFEFNSSVDGNINIYDVLGKKIFSTPVYGLTEYKVNTEAFTAGAYTVQIHIEEKVFTQMVIKY